MIIPVYWVSTSYLFGSSLSILYPSIFNENDVASNTLSAVENHEVHHEVNHDINHISYKVIPTDEEDEISA